MDVQIGKYKMGDFGLKLLGTPISAKAQKRCTATF